MVFLKKLPIVLIISGLFVLGGMFAGPQFKNAKSGHDVIVGIRWTFSQMFEVYEEAWLSVQKKASELRLADLENEKLRIENARLKLKLEGLEFSHHEEVSSKATDQVDLKISHETGQRAGRSLASLTYQPPRNLSPPQLYTLAVSYLKAGEDEKVASILTSLTGLQGNSTYRTAKNYLVTGIAWYRLGNYALADNYLDDALKLPEKEDSLKYLAQARLWKALVAKKTHKEVKAQYWLKELLDHHPHSNEAAWINPIGGEHEATQHQEDL